LASRNSFDTHHSRSLLGVHKQINLAFLWYSTLTQTKHNAHIFKKNLHGARSY
ncbi:MAG: hypothetical protein ACI8RD_005529, partial [Bacillariaceae sp.]